MKFPFILFLVLYSCTLAQKSNHVQTEGVLSISERSKNISSPTFAEVIGINGGLFLSGSEETLRKAAIFKNNRIFYLMGHDMKGRLPKDFIPKPCMSKCPNINCDWENTNAAWKFRLCDWSVIFETNTIALEVFEGTGRNYPNRFYRADELGDPYKTGFAYGQTIGESLEGLITTVEVGNEPHGTPGIKTFNQWSKGLAEGVRSKSKTMKICSADIQNSGPDKFGQTLLNNQVKDIDTSLFDILQVHAYAIDKNFKVTLPPETLRKELSDMYPYRAKTLWLGEVGWDSQLLGEETQAAYLLRAIVLAMRHDFDKVFVYNIIDDGPWAAPFDHCGLLNKDNTEKKSYKLLRRMVTEFGDYHISKIIKDGESGEFEYGFTNGKNNMTVSWKGSDRTIPDIH
ncbi:MAG TPA: hypothetical protein ENK85_12165 [Saprospiraceae bacterium]|nr:hypothetical protein [Saprospiraceae bacterium]